MNLQFKEGSVFRKLMNWIFEQTGIYRRQYIMYIVTFPGGVSDLSKSVVSMTETSFSERHLLSFQYNCWTTSETSLSGRLLYFQYNCWTIVLLIRLGQMCSLINKTILDIIIYVVIRSCFWLVYIYFFEVYLVIKIWFKYYILIFVSLLL